MIKRLCPNCGSECYSAYTGEWERDCGVVVSEDNDMPTREKREEAIMNGGCAVCGEEECRNGECVRLCTLKKDAEFVRYIIEDAGLRVTTDGPNVVVVDKDGHTEVIS